MTPPNGAAPELSVVMPTFRRPAAVRRTLDAALAQQVDAPWEMVICDDGSPPDDAASLAMIVEDARRTATVPIQLITQHNAGPAAARNSGADAARAPLLLFLDDDCAPTPGLLEIHRLAHDAYAAAGETVAVMGHVAWDPAIRVTPFMELVVRGAQFNYAAIADPNRVPFTCFYTANCSLPRSLYESAGRFDRSLPPYMEDTEFAYRLVQAGARIVYRPDAVVHHEHAVELQAYLDRQRRAGRAAVEVAARHPELFDLIRVSDVADISLREQFYSALLRYAFVVGVEEALAEQVTEGLITGQELRSQFEQWTAHWAVRQVADVRAWRERADALVAEVARRDERLASVTQEKDARIAELEAQLRRFDKLLPIRLYHALRKRRG